MLSCFTYSCIQAAVQGDGIECNFANLRSAAWRLRFVYPAWGGEERATRHAGEAAAGTRHVYQRRAEQPPPRGQ